VTVDVGRVETATLPLGRFDVLPPHEPIKHVDSESIRWLGELQQQRVRPC
jgi:hypothetical protein